VDYHASGPGYHARVGPRADGAECGFARHTGHAPRLGPVDCLHAALINACSVWARGGVRRQAAGVRFSEGQHKKCEDNLQGRAWIICLPRVTGE